MKITKLKVNNFLIFVEDEFDFNEKINLNFIYGSNGIGKSSLLKIPHFILRIIFKEFDLYNHNSIPAAFRNQKILNSLNNIYDEFITLESEESIKVAIQFVDKENEKYEYAVEIIKGDIFITEVLKIISDTNSHKIIFEKILNQSFNFDKTLFNENIIRMFSNLNKNTANSIISIIFRDINLSEEKGLLEQAVSNTFGKVYDLFLIKDPSIPAGIHEMIENNIILIPKSNIAIPNQINKINEKEIYKWQKFLDEFEDFVTMIDKSIISVKINIDDRADQFNTRVTFSLEKSVSNGKSIIVPIARESMGTKKYLSYFFNVKSILSNDDSVIYIDEFGQNLHEVLIYRIVNHISKIANNTNKQVLIATHSAILLNDKFISDDKNWNKERILMDRMPSGKISLKSLEGKNIRENNYIKFLLGQYGGAPDISEIFDDYE